MKGKGYHSLATVGKENKIEIIGMREIWKDINNKKIVIVNEDEE